MLGLTIHQGQHDRPEVALQGRAFVQFAEHLFGIGIPPQFHHHPHPLPVAFVADVGDASDAAIVYLLGKFFDPAGFTELIGQLGDHHGAAFMAPLARLHFFDVGNTAHRDAAAAIQIGVAHTTAGEHQPTGGKIRARD